MAPSARALRQSSDDSFSARSRRESSQVSTSTNRSRLRPSISASKGPFHYWCKFRLDDIPYKQKHVRMLMSIFYRLPVGTSGIDHLSASHRERLLGSQAPAGYPLELLEMSKAQKQAYTRHYEPFQRLAESVMRAAMTECKWDLLEAYAARIRHGRDGYYRNSQYPSWDVDAGSDKSAASEVSTAYSKSVV
jgi:hypothetical protein